MRILPRTLEPSAGPSSVREQVLARDPEVVILTNFNMEEALQRPAWQGLTAYQTGAVYEVNPGLVWVLGTPGYWMGWLSSFT